MAGPTVQLKGAANVHVAWSRLMHVLVHHTATSLQKVRTSGRRMRAVVR